MSQYDLVVIGAGINGAGIVRDAAMRGLNVVLFEKGDMCSATSWISSRLIHGGLRYLEYAEFPLVYESLHERRYLREIAPHLVKPLRISIPIYKGARRGPWLIRLGMIAYDILSLGKKLPRHRMLGRNDLVSAEPGLNAEGLRAAATYHDGQVAFAERLILENLLSAKEAGADIRTYCEVTGIDAGTGNTITWQDNLTGETGSVEASVVINAGGPWVDRVLATAGARDTKLIGGTKGSHIIVSPFAGAPKNAFYVEAESDGRPFFIIPWNEQYLIGTTDIRYDGDLDHIRASEKEIRYLLDETNRVFPSAGLTVKDINYAYAGVRPLPHVKEGPESAITRKHIIMVNSDIGPGIVSIIGGKLTTFRHLAEQAIDLVGKLLKRELPKCNTRTLLPGAHPVDEAADDLRQHTSLSPAGVERAISVYGARAARLSAIAADNAQLAETLDSEKTVLAAEIALAIREEFARTLADIVFRRTMIGLRPDQGRPCYDAIAAVAASEFGWDDERTRDELRQLLDYSDSLRV
jgi:glycerol-3-phosphate dehydrogenase